MVARVSCINALCRRCQFKSPFEIWCPLVWLYKLYNVICTYMTPTLKTFVLNKMRAYLCSKMFLCAIENALGLLVSCLKNRPIFYKNIGAYTDGLLLKNIFIGLYIRLSADACCQSWCNLHKWPLLDASISYCYCLRPCSSSNSKCPRQAVVTCVSCTNFDKL